MSAPVDRAIIALGAVAGLAGIGLSAMAAHGAGAGSLDTAARFLLAHAPALLAVVALIGTGHLHRGLGRAAAFTLAAGLTLFCGDLTVRALLGVAPLRLAAPAGGILLMLGWAALLLAAILSSDASRKG